MSKLLLQSRQPICWNPLIKDYYGNMLGRRTRLNCATVDEAFAANVRTWLNFSQNPLGMLGNKLEINTRWYVNALRDK